VKSFSAPLKWPRRGLSGIIICFSRNALYIVGFGLFSVPAPPLHIYVLRRGFFALLKNHRPCIPPVKRLPVPGEEWPCSSVVVRFRSIRRLVITELPR